MVYRKEDIARKNILERKLNIAKRNLAYNSFYHYIKEAWNVIEGVDFKDNWHIGCIADHLQYQLLGEKSLQKIIVNIQPRLTKSLVCSVLLPTFIWIHKPHYKILTISHSTDLAGMFTYNSRLLIESDWYKYWRDDLKFDLVKGDTRKTAYSNNKLGYRMSFGVGSKMAGYGGDYNILDDPNDLTEFNSTTQKQNVIDTYKYTWKTRVTGKDTKWLLIQQRIPGGNDLTDYLLENEGDDWFRLNIPTEYVKKFTFKSPIGKNDPRKEGELVCPKRFNNYTTEKKDSFQWNAIFQQEPSSQGGNVLKEEWLQQYLVQPLDFDLEFISADFALETNLNKSDYTVFTHIGVKRGNFYITDIYRDRIDFPTQLDEFRKFCEKHPKVELKLIEDKASGKAFKQMMQKEMIGIIGVELKNKTKEERLYTATPSIVAKKLHIPNIQHYEHQHKSVWVEPLLNEYLTFPTGEHDDILDTIVQFINYYNTLFAGTEIVYVNDRIENKESLFNIEETYQIPQNLKNARPNFIESNEPIYSLADRGISKLFE
jgi:predicted phage terminase large subunit-like protein